MFRLLAVLGVALPSLLNAAISLGPERPVAPPEYEPPIGVQSPGFVASDGTDFLVGWSDTSNVSAGLYVARVTAAGDVAPVPQQAVSVTGVADLAGCWTGSEYLLVWNDATVHAAVAAAFSRDGVMLSEPRRISPEIVRHSGRVACASGVALIAYGADRGTVYGALLGEGGRVLRTGIGGWTVPALDTTVRVASDGRDFALFLSSVPLGQSPPVTYTVARIRRSGEAVDAVARPVGTVTGGGNFEVAYGGGDYALATTSGSAMWRLILDAESLQTRVAEPLPVLNAYGLSMVWTGSEFVAGWLSLETPARLRTVAFTRADLSTLEPATPVTRPAVALYPHLATNGRTLLAVWLDSSADSFAVGGGDVAGALLDRRGEEAIRPPMFVSMTAAFQTRPAIASSGSETIVAWHERRPLDGGWHVVATRLTVAGAPLQQPVTIASDADVSPAPVVVYTGATYVIFWSSATGTAVFSRTMGKDGSLGEPVRIPGATRPFAAAAARSSILLAFATANAIEAVRLSPAGEIIDPSPILISRGRPNDVSVSSNGRDFLVVYGEGSDYWQFPSPNMRDVLAVRVTGGGTVVDGERIPVASTPANESLTAVASDGQDYLLLYGQGEFVIARRITAERVLHPGTRLPSNIRGTALAWRGDGYLAAWQSNGGQQSEIRVALLDRNGVLVERPDEPVAVTGIRASPLVMSPALAATGAGWQIVYVRRASGPEYGDAARVFVRSDAVPAPPARRRSIQR